MPYSPMWMDTVSGRQHKAEQALLRSAWRGWTDEDVEVLKFMELTKEDRQFLHEYLTKQQMRENVTQEDKEREVAVHLLDLVRDYAASTTKQPPKAMAAEKTELEQEFNKIHALFNGARELPKTEPPVPIPWRHPDTWKGDKKSWRRHNFTVYLGDLVPDRVRDHLRKIKSLQLEQARHERSRVLEVSDDYGFQDMQAQWPQMHIY